MTTGHVTELVDKFVAGFIALKGIASGSYGAGDGTFGASDKMEDINGLIEGSLVLSANWNDSDLQIPLGLGASQLNAQFQVGNLYASHISPFIHTLARTCAAARGSVDTSIVDLESFLAWYNYVNLVTYWGAMAPPEWRDIHNAVYGAGYPHPRNLYFPVMQGMTYPSADPYPNALYKAEFPGPTETNGAAVDRTKYAGGFAYVKWTGGTGAGAYSITVSGLDSDGLAETYVHSGGGPIAASNAGVILVPGGASDSLITDVTDIVFNAGVTGGTFYVEARPPSGRVYPPT